MPGKNSHPRVPDQADPGFECIDPRIGDQLGQGDDPTMPDDRRRQLDAHLALCHACRLEWAAADRLQAAVAAGEVTAPGPRRRRGRWPAASALAAAACLALVFWLPPRPLTDGGVTRSGADAARVIRPVVGETVARTTPRIRWTPVAGASSYQVELVGLDGDLRWAARTESTALEVPAAAGLTRGGRFQVIVTAVPDYLTPPPGMVTWFRTAGTLATATYRLRAAPVWLQIVLAVTVVTGLGLLVRRRRRRA